VSLLNAMDEEEVLDMLWADWRKSCRIYKILGLFFVHMFSFVFK